MKRIGAFLLLLTLGPAARAEDGLRIPRASSASLTQGGDQATLAWPFGSVRLSTESLAPAPVDAPARGAVQAETGGTFHLSYALERAGDAVRVRRLAVTAVSRPEFHVEPTAKLREHEAVHVGINDREARRIQTVLSGFRVRGVTTREAERRLKVRFREEVAAVRRLHAEWDNTHVFLSTGPTLPEIAPGPK
ncbi:MAG: hypothetical protein IPP68_02070 [Elusimicrobia bacterium]|nr:hypothetical protein [Elusimicrobiota bacterium]